ncbi:L1 [Pygoscelis adeliae papillomavirus 1]|uniref:Major capsid protein L1 n=1 Tax=Pygoscelis adeliae papillomavirus 1 TaxID=1480065 RepID=X2JJ85_9PAPI|nr:L1 [Pygoscelis adeliae papillomavirus 1]AHN65804.1 L1 [Pygoscelis adeliae papillomavirus 1]
MSAPLPPALYIPSTAQLPSVYSTDDFLEKTDYVYHCGTDRLLTVGHPYFPVMSENVVIVPKVSANSYRVFRLKLPDPNGQFPLPAGGISDPDKHRLVWQLIAIQVTRGGPVNVGLSGAPLFDRERDIENPSPRGNNADRERINTAIDPKQNQMLICGCSPAVGQHWSQAKACTDPQPKTNCPPLELTSTPLQDGDMSDIGFGALDFSQLAKNRSDLPMELVQQTSKYPDYVRMVNDPYGDSCFFLVRREQTYCRRLWQLGGNPGGAEKVPEDMYRKSDDANTNNLAYCTIPSGSVITTDTQIFNRPYWLTQSQGPNNGVLWRQNLFVTCLDNTRNTIMHISTVATTANSEDTQYSSTNYDTYSRHCEEYEISVLVRLCKVPLTTDVLSHLYRMDPDILTGWGISEAPSTAVRTEDKYRYLESQATRCPLPQPPPSPSGDPYDDMRFWTVDCTDRMSMELPLHHLGRKYLTLPQVRAPRKRPAPTPIQTQSAVTRSRSRSAAKRRRLR